MSSRYMSNAASLKICTCLLYKHNLPDVYLQYRRKDFMYKINIGRSQKKGYYRDTYKKSILQIVLDSVHDSDCYRYVCLRDRERKRAFIITENQRKFYQQFSQSVGAQVQSSERFYQIYDRLLMEKLNRDQVPEWFLKLEPIRSGLTRRRRMMKMVGFNDNTFKFITDPLVRWIISILQLDPSVFKYDKNIVNGRGSLKRVHVHVTKEILMSVLGWVLFMDSYEKEFRRPFVVEVGDVLLLEIHDVRDQQRQKHEILKVFYYSPTMGNNQNTRFKELSLQPFLDSKGLANWKMFATAFLKLLMFDSSYREECRLAIPWYSKVAKQFDTCRKYIPPKTE